MSEWTKEDLDYITKNYKDMKYSEMCSDLGRTKSAIQKKAREIGLKKENCSMAKWSDEEIDFLKNNYKNMKTSDIAKHLNRSKKSIEVKASKLGITFFKNDFDRNKFLKIETEEDAYWLGFMYADGYVCRSSSGSELAIQLKASDYKHLKKFNKYMNGNAEVTFFKEKSPCSDRICNLCSIRYYSNDVVNNLINLGCVQNKSKLIQFPKEFIPFYLIRHFIRGYFDGDGSLGDYTKYNYTRASIECGSLKFLEQVQEYLSSLNIRSGISKDYTCWKMGINGQENVMHFLNLIYKNSNIYLNRKYEKYKNSNCLNLQ